MKKKLEVSNKCNDSETFNKYFSPDFNKIVVTNVFDKFWGPCEVADSMIKRFIDTGDNNKKCEFICVEKGLTGETFAKYNFASKPKYFVSHRGNILFFSDGLDFPKLSEEIEKNFPLLDEATG